MSTALATPVPTRAQVFERGDHVYLVAPVQTFRPTDEEIASYAYGSSVTKQAPNENIVWFKGQYVEADNPNANGAQWTADELGIKSMTPMLMPVTVMHDPRTAVGTIADTALLTPDKDGVPRSRIDTVLALWGHRFPEAVHEAETNAQAGTLMQSMECYSPWYACSECGQKFHKLPGGAEQASWCDHLKASNPSAGYVDLSVAQQANASRILGDVTFTGTGLIFGSRGARGAYSEAHLAPFQDEVASYHHTVHTATFTPQRSTRMGLVQIEDTELAALRQERDAAKAEATKVPDLTTKLHTAEQAAEKAEQDKVAVEKERDDAKAEAAALKEETAQASLKDKRVKALGPGFTAKLGEFTKGRLDEQAKSMTDEEWDNRLKEIEETAGVKRDAEADGSSGGGDDGDGGGSGSGGDGGAAPTFKPEELAALQNGVTSGGNSVGREDAASVVGSLATVFNPPKTPAKT